MNKFEEEPKDYEPVDVYSGSIADFDNQLGVNQDTIQQLEGQ